MDHGRAPSTDRPQSRERERESPSVTATVAEPQRDIIKTMDNTLARRKVRGAHVARSRCAGGRAEPLRRRGRRSYRQAPHAQSCLQSSHASPRSDCRAFHLRTCAEAGTQGPGGTLESLGSHARTLGACVAWCTHASWSPAWGVPPGGAAGTRGASALVRPRAARGPGGGVRDPRARGVSNSLLALVRLMFTPAD